MIKRRFYKLEHGDKDSGSDSSCFSSDSDRDWEESEVSVGEVSEDDDSGSESGGEYEEAPASEDNANDDDDDDDDGGRFEKRSMNLNPDLEEPPEENYILGCMIKCKSVYKCRYCPNTICLNEATMQAHISSKKHSRSERLFKGEKLRTNDEQVDDPQLPSQEKEIKGNRRSQRQGKRSLKEEKLRTDGKAVDKPETPSQEKQIKENRRWRRSQKQEKDSPTTQGENGNATQKSAKRRRQTKD